MNKKFIMLSGLPRSGSSVLSSMLNQHPDIYASTTSPVIDLIEIVNNNWMNISAALVNPNLQQYPNMIKGICNGAYEHVDKPVIIDKNRIWPRYGKLMTHAFGYKPKIICTVRNIPEILSSYILLINKNSDKLSFVDKDLYEINLPINNKNRCKLLWEKYMNGPYNSVRIGYNSPDVDLFVVDYDDIVNNSQQVMDKICNFIEIDKVVVDLNNLQQMKENDDFHGGMIGLHDVRSAMKRTSPKPEDVIGHELVKQYTNMKLDFWNK